MIIDPGGSRGPNQLHGMIVIAIIVVFALAIALAMASG